MNYQDLDTTAGENRTFTLTARNASNAVQDLTGLTLSWRVGRGPFVPQSATPNFTYPGTIVSAPAGTFTVSITPTDTQNMLGTYLHQAYTIDAASNVAIVCQGEFRVHAGITT